VKGRERKREGEREREREGEGKEYWKEDRRKASARRGRICERERERESGACFRGRWRAVVGFSSKHEHEYGREYGDCDIDVTATTSHELTGTCRGGAGESCAQW